MRFIGLMFLLLSVTTLADNHSSPEMTIERYFSSFNDEDMDALNKTADSPFFYIIDGKPRSYERFGDAIDFEGLKASGWSYSLMHSKELVYSDDLTAAVRVNFSRFNESDEVISTSDVVYLLVRRDEEWKVKGGLLSGTLTLGK